MYYRVIRQFVLAPLSYYRRNLGKPSRFILRDSLSASELRHPRFMAPSSPLPGLAGRDVAAVFRRLKRIRVRQLLFFHLFFEGGGTSPCNPPECSPVEPARPHVPMDIFLLSHKATMTSIWQCTAPVTASHGSMPTPGIRTLRLEPWAYPDLEAFLHLSRKRSPRLPPLRRLPRTELLDIGYMLP